MRRIMVIFAAAMMAAGMMAQEVQEEKKTPEKKAQEKMSFVVEGPEKSYNQIRVENNSSHENVKCRVVKLDENDEIIATYGIYELKGIGDSDTNTDKFKKGTKIGIQIAKDINHQFTFEVEYRDVPFFDVVVIHLTDADAGFDSEF